MFLTNTSLFKPLKHPTNLPYLHKDMIDLTIVRLKK